MVFVNSAADKHLIDQVEDILTTCASRIGSFKDWRLEPITNSFQDKNNVYKIELPHGRDLVLKLEHEFFESSIAQEGLVLDFLTSTDIPTPDLIHAGTCDIFSPEGKAPRYLLMEFVEGIPMNWVYYEASADERRDYLNPRHYHSPTNPQ